MAKTPALEALFADAEQQASALLENITAAIDSKVNTIEEGEALVQKLSEEAARFNKILVTLDNTKSQVESGDITREQGLGIVEPLVQELKSNCCALQMCGANMSDSDDIDVAEIAVLREIIAGAKSAAEARVVALRTDADLSPDTESMSVLGMFGNIANENLTDMRKYLSLRNSAEAQNAKLLAQNARKLYSMGSKDKANEYMAKAKALYQKCLEDAKNQYQWFTVKRTTKSGNNTDEYTTVVTDDASAASIIVYFEDRVDSCEAYLRQWKNKAGNVDLNQTKAALKAERIAERDRIRAQKKGANESMNTYTQSNELVAALEGYLAQLDGEDMILALEADSDESNTSSSAVAKAKSGDISGATSDLKDNLDSANAEIKNGNHTRAIVIAIGVAVAALAIITVYAAKSKSKVAEAARNKVAGIVVKMKSKYATIKAAHDAKKLAKQLSRSMVDMATTSIASIADSMRDMSRDIGFESMNTYTQSNELVAALEGYLAQLDGEDMILALEADSDESNTSSSAVAKAKSGDISGATSDLKDTISSAKTEVKNGNHKRAIVIAIGVAVAALAIITVYAAKSKSKVAEAARNKVAGIVAKIKSLKNKKGEPSATDANSAINDASTCVSAISALPSGNSEPAESNESFGSRYDQMFYDAVTEDFEADWDIFSAAIEGATSDALDIWKQQWGDIRDRLKMAKNEKKNNNYTKAAEYYDQCASLCAKMMADIDNIPEGTMGSVICGGILRTLKNLILGVVPVVNVINTVKELIRSIDEHIDYQNKIGGKLTRNDLNKTLTYIRTLAKQTIVKCKAAAAKCRELAKKTGASTAKESAGIDSILADLGVAQESSIEALVSQWAVEDGIAL